MSLQDPIAQLITVINNAQRAHKHQVSVRYSGIKESICVILQEEGYINSYSFANQGVKRFLMIDLKYVGGKPAIKMFKRVSKSSCRKYSGVNDFMPVMNGLGTLIVSTSRGVCTSQKAADRNVGGELLCQVF